MPNAMSVVVYSTYLTKSRLKSGTTATIAKRDMRSKAFKHTSFTNWLDKVESVCPACGDPIDYCQGHGEIGDPEGYAILKQQEETA